MNDIIARIQESFSQPDLWSQPTTWVCVACGVGALLLVVRLMFRRKRPAETEAPSTGRPNGGGAFGALTPALASQIPESQKEKKEFGQMLKQAGMYSPTARASVYAFRFLLMVFPLIVAGILAVAEPQHTWRYLIAGVVIAYWAEANGTSTLSSLGLSGGNMEGKEVRFGIVPPRCLPSSPPPPPAARSTPCMTASPRSAA